MRRRVRRWIPSMYQRRLLLVAAGCVLAMAAPAVQLARLTTAKGAQLRAAAESKLVTERWLPTVRGRIVDRKGRVLALDRPAFDVAFEYPVITGQWAATRAARKARREHAAEWSGLSREERDELAQRYLPEYLRELDAMWDRVSELAGVSRADVEARKGEIIAEVRLMAATITEWQRQRLESRLGELDETSFFWQDPPEAGEREVRTAEVRRPIREEATHHVVLPDVPQGVGFAFMAIEQRATTANPGEGMPGLRVIDQGRRTYPLESARVTVDRSSFPAPLRRAGADEVVVEGLLTHVIGWMREGVHPEDIQARERELAGGSAGAGVDRGRYFPGDAVGHAGLERGAEFELRGRRGARTTHLDTGEVETTPPAAGTDVTLTIDAHLQARVQALFEPALGLTVVQPWHRPRTAPPPSSAKELPLGTPLNGAVVVLDADTGEVLAMVSAPGFTRTRLAAEGARIAEDQVNTPLLNRAINKAYQPGSIVKPLVFAAAATAGRASAGERIACGGHFFPDKPLLYRCWIYKQFHTTHTDRLGADPDAVEAIMASCNIYFFELGRRLGVRGMFEWYSALGVGPAAEGWRLGIGPEFRGQLADPAKPELNEAILMGIGQGPVAWTPLHAADAYATLARAGVRLTPRVRAWAGGGGEGRTQEPLPLDPGAVAAALEGLARSATDPGGTTHHVTFEMADGESLQERIFNAPAIDIWAKSGTADVAPFVADLAGQGAESFDGDHAWCVLLAGTGGKPRYAVAVVVDHGGSGGRVAGPVANQVVHALIAEGYLPRIPAGEPAPAEDTGEG